MRKHWQRDSRGELEGYAVATGTAGDSVAVEVAFVVEDQLADGLGSVGADEGVQDIEIPLAFGSRRELVHNAAFAVRAAAGGGRAIEITRFVHNHAATGFDSVCASCEAVHNSLLPVTVCLQRQPIDGAVARRAAYAGRPVKITHTVERERP